LHAGGDALTGDTVSIALTGANPHPSGQPDTGGLIIQLSCFSLSAPEIKTKWQQYVIESPPGNGAMAGHTNNYTSTGSDINFWVPLVKQLPVVDTLARVSSLSPK